MVESIRDKDPHPEVIHCHSQGVHNLCINSLILQIDEVHFLSDGLQGSLRAKGGKISTHVAMGLICHLKANGETK